MTMTTQEIDQLAACRMRVAVLHTALTEMLNADGIMNYDSTVCWGCGEPEADKLRGRQGATPEIIAAAKHSPDCMLERVRAALASSEPEMLGIIGKARRVVTAYESEERSSNEVFLPLDVVLDLAAALPKVPE